MGYVKHADGVTKDLVGGADWSIELACETHSAQASLRPFFDAAGDRVAG
jgi:4-methylaminobutanoate oxidase (formaldehyde-forming)